MADTLPAEMAAFSAKKMELLQILLEEEDVEPRQDHTILPRRDAGDLSLSFAQSRLWFLTELEPESSFYHISRAYQLAGDLRVETLQQSFKEIVRRHEILRTTFPNRNGQPSQLITPTTTFQVQTVSLDGCDEVTVETALQSLLSAEIQRPFDLVKGPLLRARCLLLGNEITVLILVIHHIL